MIKARFLQTKPSARIFGLALKHEYAREEMTITSAHRDLYCV